MEVKVERIAPEGEGIARAAASPGGGKVVFVPYALPGERVEIEPVQEKTQYLRGRLLSVLEGSAARVEPRCPYHFRPGGGLACGGCDWQHADYREQLRLKRAIAADCMTRIAKLDAPILETIASPAPWRYRNKVQIPFQSAPAPRLVKAGFYAPGSHHLVEFKDCAVQPELSVAIHQSVLAFARRWRWRAYDEKRGVGWLRHLYIRTNAAGEAGLAFVTRTPAFPNQGETVLALRRMHPRVVGIWQNVQEAKTSVILGQRWRKLWGRDFLSETIGPLTLQFSPGAFLQVNTPAAEVLYRVTEAFLFEEDFKPHLALDVYCGIGAIAFWIAPRVPRVFGIEESEEAVQDACRNALRLKTAHVRFISGKAEVVLSRLPDLEGLGKDAASYPRPWAAVLDPPRAGCDPAVLQSLARHRLERLVYVSCNPATFARDARRLVDAGYDLKKIQPVDLFPQTSHVELAARFDFRT